MCQKQILNGIASYAREKCQMTGLIVPKAKDECISCAREKCQIKLLIMPETTAKWMC